MNSLKNTFFDYLGSDKYTNLKDNKLSFIDKLNLVLETSDNTKDEIELKILDIDLKQITKKLDALGAKRIFGGWIKDNRFDFSDNKLRKQNIIVRTRETSSGNYLTIKKIIEDKQITINKEFEVKIDKINNLISEIRNIGMDLLKEKRLIKYRISYELDGVRFDLDRYDDIPWLLEIEAESKQELDKYIVKLGLEKNYKVKYGHKGLKDLYDL